MDPGPLETPTGVRLTVMDATLQSFLDDDLGTPPRDVTTDPLFRGETALATIITREPCVASGIEEAVRVFGLVGAQGTRVVNDGERAPAGASLAEVRGPTAALLRGERTALNIMGRMCGIATETARAQALVVAANPECRVAATRKTTPGFRMFEKRAVAHGGGDPHRYGLFDQVLVKDNHRAAFPDLEALVMRLREANPSTAIEVEVETRADAERVARLGVDWLLLDNMNPDQVADVARAVRAIDDRVRLEASGGINADNVAAYAPHVDRVSMGALTQSARAIDLSLEWHPDD